MKPKLTVLILALIAVAFVVSATVFASGTNVTFYYGGSTNTFLAYYRSSKSPTHVAPAKSLCLTNGITFKGVVDVLGPGWRPPSEGIGLVCWPFTDGRTLCVRLPHHPRNGSTPLTTNAFIWHTNWPGEWDDPKHPVPEPKYIVW
jgi:hypothetical protein